MTVWFQSLVQMISSVDVTDLCSTLLAVAVALGGSDVPKKPEQIGVASRFGSPGDKHIGGRMICTHTYVSSTKHQCAHRKYKCGTKLIIENVRTKKRSWCTVTDRGPYGARVLTANRTVALKPGGNRAWYVKKRKHHKPPSRLCPHGGCTGEWRGVIDLSPTVSYELEHNGFEDVRIWRLDRFMHYLYIKNIKRLCQEIRDRQT